MSRRMLPYDRPRLSRENALKWLHWGWPPERHGELPEAGSFFLVAVRGYYLSSMGRAEKNDRGIYDDAVFVIAGEDSTSFNFNTDPNSYRDGIATLEAPQRVIYKPGWHGYNSKHGHPAFRQASEVIVRRDGGEGNGTPLGDGRFRDRSNSRFWINLHRGGITRTNSAGCLTVPPNQWDAFYTLVKLNLQRFELDRFPLYLINDPRIPHDL